MKAGEFTSLKFQSNTLNVHDLLIHRSSSQYNSLQPFQPVMYPSSLAPLARSSSNPDLIGDPITLDARSLTEKMSHVRKFWQHGIQTALTSLVNVQQSEAQQVQPPKEAEDRPS